MPGGLSLVLFSLPSPPQIALSIWTIVGPSVAAGRSLTFRACLSPNSKGQQLRGRESDITASLISTTAGRFGRRGLVQIYLSPIWERNSLVEYRMLLADEARQQARNCL